MQSRILVTEAVAEAMYTDLSIDQGVLGATIRLAIALDVNPSLNDASVRGKYLQPDPDDLEGKSLFAWHSLCLLPQSSKVVSYTSFVQLWRFLPVLPYEPGPVSNDSGDLPNLYYAAHAARSRTPS